MCSRYSIIGHPAIHDRIPHLLGITNKSTYRIKNINPLIIWQKKHVTPMRN